MTETVKKQGITRGPGTAVPWEELLAEIEPIPGDEKLVKSEWENLDTFAYMYLWYWVHR